MNILKAFFLLIVARKQKIVHFPWCTALGLLVSSYGFPPLIPAVITVVAMLMIATSVYVYNDICDLAMDKHNPDKLKNPLPSGRISVREAMIIVYVSGVVGLVLSLLSGIVPFVLAAIYMVLFLSYSNPVIRLKKKFLLKEGTLAIGTFFSIIIGNAAVGPLMPITIFLGIFASAFLFVISPSMADQQDIKEDKLFGVKTLATLLAWKTKLEMLIGFVIVFMMLTPLTYVNFGLNVIFPIITLFLSLLFLRYLFPIIAKYEHKGWRRAFKNGFVYYYGFQLAFILGSLPIFL